jgi:hypothetical protein
MSIPNASVQCANILLPDDAGYFGRGSVDYIITMEPDPYETWSDLSYERVSTDENNTGIIPVCFSSLGKPLGNCSRPFTIRIKADSIGVDKSWSGGACVSRYADFDTNVPPAPGAGQAGEGQTGSGQQVQAPMQGLDSVDILSMGFVEMNKRALSGEPAEFVLYLQSHADLSITLSSQAAPGVSITPSSAQATISDGSRFHEMGFNVTAASYGTHYFTVTASIEGCSSASVCTKQAGGELIVGDSVPELAGFTAMVFPENINIRDLEPVTYRLTVTNMGDSDEFSIDASLPAGVQSTFSPTTLTVPSGESRTVTFDVTPESVSSSYELDFSVESGEGIRKPFTAYLSTNEMLTDAMRNMDAISQGPDAAATVQSRQQLDGWYQTYQGSGYGQGLDDYAELQGSLADARQAAANQMQGGQGDGGSGQDSDSGQDGSPASGSDYLPMTTGQQGIDLFGKDLWMLLVVLLAVLGAALVVVQRRKPRGDGLDQEIDLGESSEAGGESF